MNIRITTDSSGYTKIEQEDGSAFPGAVSAVDVRLRPNSLPQAMLQFDLPTIGVIAEARVDEEHLRALAAAHGFKLVRG